MEFNVQKCAVLSITRKRKPSHYQYSIFGQPFANVDQHDYLGITIASELRWNSHCNNVFKKSNKTLGLLRRTLAPCSEDVKTKAYESLIRPGSSMHLKLGAHILHLLWIKSSRSREQLHVSCILIAVGRPM